MKRRELLQSLGMLPFVGLYLKAKKEVTEPPPIPVTTTEDMDPMVQFGHMDERLGAESLSMSTAMTCDMGSTWEERELAGKKCPRCKHPATVEQRVGSVGVAKTDKAKHPLYDAWIEYNMKCKKCGKEYRVRPQITT